MKHKPDGYYWDEDSMAIAELAELARIMEEISEDSPLFFRGTADGQTQPWDRPLVEGFVFKEVTRFIDRTIRVVKTKLLGFRCRTADADSKPL
jgi:hypothetical protein